MIDEVNERIKQIRKILNLSQTAFGKRLGVTRSVIANIESNKVVPKDVFIRHISDVFKIKEDWLHGKNVNPLMDENDEIKLNEIMNLFPKLTPRFQDHILRTVSELLDIQNSEE